MQTPEERRSKEKIAFDNAMSTCSAHWKNMTFDNFSPSEFENFDYVCSV